MKRLFIISIIAAIAALSCSKTESPLTEHDDLVRASASILSDTKTSLSGSRVLWTNGDKIQVFSNSDSEGGTFKLSSGEGTTSGEFYGKHVEGTTFYAAYPTSATFNGSTFTFNLPASVNYTEGSFAQNNNPMLSVGQASLTGFSMKNLCGVLKLSLKGNFEMEELELTFSGDVSGSGTVSAGSTTISMAGGSAATKKITMNCSGLWLSTSTYKVFYFVVPPGTYSSLTITGKTDDDKQAQLVHGSSFTITRSCYTEMSGTLPSVSIRPEITPYSLNVSCQSNDDNSSWPSVGKWSNRRAGIYAFINTESPDILCTQECEYRQRSNILSNCSGYSAYGLGQEYGKNTGGSSGSLWWKEDYDADSANAIFWKTSLFDVQDQGTFWLSSTPNKVNSGTGRTCTWIKFRRKSSGKVFYVFNTHFTAHYTDDAYAARKAEAGYLYDQMASINSTDLPAILAGDFNESASDIRNEDKGDTRWSNYYWARNVDGKTDKNNYPTSYNDFKTTYDGSTTTNPCSNLDHIAYKNFYENSKHGLKPGSFETLYGSYGGVTYISDHWPIRATLIFDY